MHLAAYLDTRGRLESKIIAVFAVNSSPFTAVFAVERLELEVPFYWLAYVFELLIVSFVDTNIL